MSRLKFVIFLIVFGATFCQDIEEYEDYSEENTRREIRQYNQDAWRPARLSVEETPGWSTKEEPQSLSDIKIKRRRLRKRKRKPPLVEDGDPYPEIPPRRKVRPHVLEDMRELWKEMEEDAISKPNVRRRVTPVYQPSKESEEKTDWHVGAENRNQANEVLKKPTEPENTQSSKPPLNTISDLKKLLKKTGGNISLSELLQQKNLSLAELLSGNEKAISVLTEPPPQAIESAQMPTEPEQIHKYKRLPPSIALKKTTDRNYEVEADSVESLTAKELMEAQRKRLAILGAKESKLYSTVAQFDVFTEATTERRIFVPAHPKYYTSMNFKPDFLSDLMPFEKSASTTSTTTSTVSPSTAETIEAEEAAVKKKGALPTTNAKLKQTTKKLKEEGYPFPFEFPKPSKISLNEIIGLNYEGDDSEDGGEPLRMPIDIKTSIDTNKEQVSVTTEIHRENVTLVTAREEIMEIMKDPTARDSLSRILEIRNMTLQELVEQRERGSSQLHLADIFHNNTREPEPKEEPLIGQINPEYFDVFKSYERKQKSLDVRKEENEGNHIYTTIGKTVEAVTGKTVEAVTGKTVEAVTGKTVEAVTGKTVEVVTAKLEKMTIKSTELYPEVEQESSGNSITFPWKQLYPDIFSESLESERDFIDPRKKFIDENSKRVENSDIDYISTINEIYDADDNIFMNIPSGVKSALFVSLAIIGLSLIVFIAILVILRCLQRKTRAANYCSSLSSRMRSPMILQGRSTAAIKSFMNETLGRKNNYVRSSMKSVSDNIWVVGKERKDSF
nr:uncharacterized protein LOC111510211 [Leptinotarsa decemlineata]